MNELDQSPIADERLELIFTCCHPALATDAQVALTLRALGGLSTEEIARAFLVSEETMKRRLSRAKAKIRRPHPVLGAAGPLSARPAAAVLAVIYLIYNEGYGGRVDLAGEAIRLGRVLVELMPDEPEVARPAVVDDASPRAPRARFSGEDLVLLADQDRSLWDVGEMAQARELLDRALALRGRGAYVIQAAIASLQTQAEIDWPQIVALYAQLSQLTGSPVVELNRAVAIAEAGSPEQALELVDQLDLDEYRYLHSTRGELLRRLGRGDEAREAYGRALELTTSEPERRFLQRRIGEL